MSQNNQNNLNLESLAQERKILVHDPFAEFLHAQPILHSFEISLLNCYQFAGHACHAITGAYLATEAAIENLFPETQICERGDLSVEFGSSLGEAATGPRSNVISYITGAWAESGFPGLKGNFVRKGLVTYGNSDISKKSIRFRRLSNQKSITVEYDPSEIIKDIKHNLDFPESWRLEIYNILKNSEAAIRIQTPNL
jgi:hypothetical protein